MWRRRHDYEQLYKNSLSKWKISETVDGYVLHEFGVFGSQEYRHQPISVCHVFCVTKACH